MPAKKGNQQIKAQDPNHMILILSEEIAEFILIYQLPFFSHVILHNISFARDTLNHEVKATK